MKTASGYENILTGSTLRGNVLGLTGKGGTGYVTVDEEARRSGYSPVSDDDEASPGDGMNGLGRLIQRRAQPHVAGLGDYFTTSSQLRGFGGGFGRAFGDLLDDLVSVVSPQPDPIVVPIQKGLTTPDPVTGQDVLRPDIGQAACGDKMKYDPATQSCLPISGTGGGKKPVPVVVPGLTPPPASKAGIWSNPLTWAGILVAVGVVALVVAKSSHKPGGAASSSSAHRLRANRRSRRYRNNGAAC